MLNEREKEIILVVEDDRKTASLVAMYMEDAGYEPLLALDGNQALELAAAKQPDLVILDLMLPGLDGWSVCAKLREQSQVPVIMLTARGDEEDRILGLNLGADDYVVKPFSPRELAARVNAVLRRGREPAILRGRLVSDGLEIDLDNRTVTLDGKTVGLTPHEYRLLQSLMSQPGKVFTRQELLERLYPGGDVVVIDRVVDVHIGKLRHKVERDPINPQFIQTVRGMGYRFTGDAPQ